MRLELFDGSSKLRRSVLVGMIALGLRSTAPAAPPTTPAALSPTLEERLRKQDELIQQLVEQNKKLTEQLESVSRRLDGRSARGLDNDDEGSRRLRDDAGTEGGAGARDNPAGMEDATSPPIGGPDDEPAEGSDASTEGGAGARDNPPEPVAGRAENKKSMRRLIGNFGPGFEFETEDEEYQLQIHNETQIESRIFGGRHQDFVKSGFDIPRQIWAFSGRITKPIEYMISINKGLGSFNLRDVFLNVHYDDRFMVKFGRYRVPYTYEFYAISNTDLMSPERSLYAMNYGLNRQIGLMGWGQLFDKRLDYAAGIYNGGRNSFEDFNNAKDVIAYLNARPFGTSEIPALEHLNFGGSVDFGSQDNPLMPRVLRTAINGSNSDGAASSAPAFLAFNDNVRELGERALWSLHTAYFYKGLSLIAEWESGFNNYGFVNRPSTRVRLPVSGYYVQAGYFLTGEHVTRRTQVKPLRPFDLREGRRGWGAWEVHGRYSALQLGDQVFNGGLADANQWTNQVFATDIGLNWYINQYLKVYFDWQHAEFGRSVIAGPGAHQKTSDLFWLRAQLYF